MSEFYKTAKWRRIRAKILKRDNYMDMIKKRFGKVKEATLVHHIFPREDYPEYQYAEWNLISVSRDTHNELHDRNTNELTSKGIELLRRTARKNKIPIPVKYSEAKDRPPQ